MQRKIVSVWEHKTATAHGAARIVMIFQPDIEERQVANFMTQSIDVTNTWLPPSMQAVSVYLALNRPQGEETTDGQEIN